MINYETFMTALINNSSSELLKNQITEILNKQRNIFKRQKLDYLKSLNSLIILKQIVRREKIWNMFKNYDTVKFKKINFFRKIMDYYQ